MATNVDRERMERFLKEEFIPAYSRTAIPKPEDRIATATEYAAYHLGQIDTKLDRIIALLGQQKSG